MTFTKRFLSLFLIGATLVLTGQGCTRSNPEAERLAAERVTLEIWRVFDEDDAFDQIMETYDDLHPNIRFDYRRLRADEYERELLEAFARGEGPDIFSVHNTWIESYKDLVTPMPDSVTIPYTEIQGTVKKERITTLREEPTVSIARLRRDYVDVVSDDVIRSFRRADGTVEQRIFGLPLSVDTLAMYVNQDLLNAAGVAVTPEHWRTFQQDVVPALTQVGQDNQIIQSGAAIGTSENVERAFDLLSLLMMQNGTAMTDARGRSSFAEQNENRDVPGILATQFYTSFANPLVQNYTWNANQPNSLDAFINGETAIFFGYSYHLPIIRARNESLNFGIAPIPQIQGGRQVNYANYWVESVSRSTEHSDWAWDFIQFAASAEHVPSYLEEANKPTARRGLIETQIEDEDLSVFASQLLTAKSWYKGDDAQVTEDAFSDLIDDFLAGQDPQEAIEQAQNKVNQTF